MLIDTKKSAEQFLINNFPAQKIVVLGEGRHSFAFLVEDYVFRFPRDAKHVKKYKRSAHVLSLLRPVVGTLVPDLMVVQDNNGIVYSSHKMIPGNYWTPDDLNIVPARVQNLLARDYAKFLYAVHSVRLDSFAQKNKSDLPVMTRERMRELADNKIPKDKLDKIYERYRSVVAAPRGGDIVLLHADLSGKNSVVDDNFRLAGVFDFDNSALGERAWDFIRFYKPGSMTLLNKILREYGKISGVAFDMEQVADACLWDAVNSARDIGKAGTDESQWATRQNLFVERMGRF